MRLLLIAYEFPPGPSPQSLRWSSLVRELLAQGVEVHVLTVESWWPSGLLQPPSGAIVHRARAGGVAGIIAMSKRWRRLRGRSEQDPAAAGAAPVAADSQVQPPAAAPVLNWKGRLLNHANQMIAKRTFPDERGRWEPFARRMLVDLLDSVRPDVVVSSHEPATTLRLGRLAKERGFAWVADLGDPVLSFYTPERWRKESLRLERWTCRNADRVIVTTEAAKWMLAGRHEVPESRLTVLTQGYDAATTGADTPGTEFDPGRLELLYTGSFYQFREPRALVDAVLATPGARLNIATSRAPDWLLQLLDRHPEQLRLLGFVPHLTARALQRQSDVLVNLANDDPVQVPGKFYEYLGAGRPILHLGDCADPVGQRMGALRRGWICAQEAGTIAGLLAKLVQAKAARKLDDGLQLDLEDVAEHSWQWLGMQLDAIVRAVVARASATTSVTAPGT